MCALLLVVGTVPLIGATYAYGEEQPVSKQQKEPEQSAQGDKEGVERSAAETIEALAEATINYAGQAIHCLARFLYGSQTPTSDKH